MERTMIKISVNEDIVMLRTYSRRYGRSGQFVLWKRELDKLDTERKILSKDGWSFASLWRSYNQTGKEKLQIEITWLSTFGEQLIGHKEQLVLFYEDFLQCVEESAGFNGKTFSLLSLPEARKPLIEFKSSHNLKKVVQKKIVRHKLGKFLANNFLWADALKIKVRDDSSVPYSFFFQEERLNGPGICGGIILHDQDNMKKSYYGLHT